MFDTAEFKRNVPSEDEEEYLTQFQKKAEKLLSDAKKEADKHKRDSLLELKEESYKIKSETDKEIKEIDKNIMQKDFHCSFLYSH